MTRDYYYDARKIADELQQEGVDECAQNIRDVIEGGSTGTEILMGLRFHLNELVKNGVTTNTDLMSRMHELSAAINKVLG